MSGLIRRAADRWRREFALVRTAAHGAGAVAATSAPGAAADDDPEIEAFARAVLGTLAEPGDGVLGRLIAALGAEQAAERILARTSADRLVAEAADGGEAIRLEDAEHGIARWAPRIRPDAFVRGLAQAHRVGAVFLVPRDRDWPGGVDDLGVHAPIGLWVRGRPGALAGDARTDWDVAELQLALWPGSAT